MGTAARYTENTESRTPTFPMLSVCSVAAKPFCVFCAVVARHAGRRNHISLCQICGCEASAFRRRTRQARPSRFPADATSASLPFPDGRDKRVPPISRRTRQARPSRFASSVCAAVLFLADAEALAGVGLFADRAPPPRIVEIPAHRRTDARLERVAGTPTEFVHQLRRVDRVA